VLAVISSAVLTAGVRLVIRRWPLASGAHLGLLAKITRVTWALTDAVSTYWLHPQRLLALPASELTWMAVSPIAGLTLLYSAARLVQLCGLRPRWPRLSLLAGISSLPCLVTGATWVIASQHAVRASYRAGTLGRVSQGSAWSGGIVCA
jgi:hypothetical protein